MHELYEIKEMLMNELKQYGNKGELTSGTLEIVDKLTHSIKNICKIIEAYEEEEYSSRGSYDGGSYEGGSYRDGSYAYARGRGGRNSYENENMSYARGRGRNARRDSMGRYASEGRYSRNGGYSMDSGEMVSNLREMIQEAPNDQIKMEMQKLVQKMEQQM